MSDTSEITTGCLVHYDSRHIQVRADFMGLCQYNRDQYREQRKKEPNQECMAKILRLLETLTDHARTEWKLKTMRAEEKGLAKPKEPEHYLIDLSNGGIVNLIYKTFGESTVRNSLNYLGAIGYIGTSQEKKNAIPSIWLEQDYVQSLLKLQAQVILAGYEFRPPSKIATPPLILKSQRKKGKRTHACQLSVFLLIAKDYRKRAREKRMRSRRSRCRSPNHSNLFRLLSWKRLLHRLFFLLPQRMVCSRAPWR